MFSKFYGKSEAGTGGVLGNSAKFTGKRLSLFFNKVAAPGDCF